MFNEIIANTSKIIISNADKIKLTLAAIFSEGSILIEDNPGSGKTTLAKTYQTMKAAKKGITNERGIIT